MYKTGDIVIVDMFDGETGHVVAPAIIRYYDEDNDAYEANVFIPRNPEHNMGQLETRWWPIAESNIREKVGELMVERYGIRPKG